MASVKELVRSAGGNMSFIDYQGSYKDDNKEFLRGDMWEFEFINPPKIVYYPGKDLINKRLNSVNISINTSTNGFEKRMRGNYTIMQKTGQMTNGQLALSFVDKEDQAISYFVDDWRQKIADRDTKYSFRKDDVVADCKMILTNSSRKTVRTVNFWNCIIDDAPLDMNGVAEDGTDRSDVQLTMSFEHYDLEWNNL
jgi:hypothetical protein